MRMLIRDKDYVADGTGGFQMCREELQLAEAAMYLLTARRGGFAPMPEVGSRLHLLPFEKPSARQAVAEVYVQEALEPLGLQVVGVDVIPGEVLTVAVRLEVGSGEQALEVYVQ